MARSLGRRTHCAPSAVGQQNHPQVASTRLVNRSPATDTAIGLDDAPCRRAYHLFDPCVTNRGTIRPRTGRQEVSRCLHGVPAVLSDLPGPTRCEEVRSRCYMLRRYSPPTSYSAWLICPSELYLTACISCSNRLRRSRAVVCSRLSEPEALWLGPSTSACGLLLS